MFIIYDMAKYHYKAKGKKSKNFYRAAQITAIFFSVNLCILFLCMMIFKPNSSSDAVTTDKKEYYAVCLATFDSASEAKNYAEKVKNRNGAGYVVNERGYRVLASVYEKKTDCESVIQKLTAAGQECSLLKIEIPKVKILQTELSKTNITAALNLFYTTVENLYLLSLQIDTLKTTSEEAVAALNNYAKNIIFSMLKSDLVSIKIKAELTALKSNLTSLASSGNEGYILSAEIKYLQIKILYDVKEMLYEIKE